MLVRMEAPATRLTLEIDRGSDPISGRLGDEHGTRPFFGWLELAAALQAALDPAPDEGGSEGKEDADAEIADRSGGAGRDVQRESPGG